MSIRAMKAWRAGVKHCGKGMAGTLWALLAWDHIEGREVTVSISELARKLGCERETILSALASLQAQGVVLRTGQTIVLVLEDTGYVPIDGAQTVGKSDTPPVGKSDSHLSENPSESVGKSDTHLLKKERKKNTRALTHEPAHEASADPPKPWGEAEQRLLVSIQEQQAELDLGDEWVREMWRRVRQRAADAQRRQGRCADEAEKWKLFQWIMGGEYGLPIATHG